MPNDIEALKARLEGFAQFLDADHKPNGAAICREAASALKSAPPSQSDDTLTTRLRQYEGQQFETTACYNGLRDEAADRIDALTHPAPLMDEVEAVLDTTRAIVSEAAMTGFNCHDGDWAEKLYANQASLSALLTKLQEGGR